ncbi:MAG: hypothetical protein EPN22_04185 [Nitrospirae bacterium]|nr:MAG: hypothetical protein EPN22_04185 [Nitrospirota bacterium]
MPEKVVCNTSPLIFLSKINKLNLLETYNLYVPHQVEVEISKGLKRHKEDAQQIIKYLGGKSVSRTKVALLKDLPAFLGPGERAAISLAVKEGIAKVFIDEAKARRVARFKGLEPKGTLGILWDAYKNRIIDRKTTELLVFDLVQEGYRIKEDIFIEFLRKLKG